MLPQFLIVGSMKSGTSTLSDYLSLHEDIFIPKRELHFFNDDKAYNKGIDFYKSYFNEAQQNQLIGEKTPTYSYLEKVPKRIYEMNPNIKLIWIFREPVARAYSNYWHAIVKGAEKNSFESCVKEELNNDITDPFRKYLERSKYIDQIEMYLQYFSINQMYFMTFEDFIENTEEELENLVSFLEVSKEKFEIPTKNLKSNQRKTLPLSFTLQYYSKKKLGNSGIPFKVINKLNQKKVEKYPSIDPELKRELKEFFKPYNIRLKQLINIDSIKKWN